MVTGWKRTWPVRVVDSWTRGGPVNWKENASGGLAYAFPVTFCVVGCVRADVRSAVHAGDFLAIGGRSL